MTARDGTNRGGYQAPRRPAAVSGPGAGSARTDGGPGNARQPIRVPTGGAYGEAGALEAQQKSAPMAAGGPSGVGGAPSAPAAPVGQGIFGPTQMPGQSPLAGAARPSPMVDSPQAFLRVLASKYPHPAIQRLVDWSATGERPPR